MGQSSRDAIPDERVAPKKFDVPQRRCRMLLTDMRIEMLDELDLGLAITTAAKQSLRIQLRIPIEIV